MAKNLSQLTVLTVPETTDLAYLVRPSDSDSTADKQITVANLFDGIRAYGQLYLELGVDPTEAITTTPEIIVDYNQVGITKGMSVDAGTGVITVGASTLAGVANVTASISLEASANAIYGLAIYKNNQITPLAAMLDLENNATNGGTVSLVGILSFAANDTFDLRIWVAAGTSTITFLALSFSVAKT